MHAGRVEVRIHAAGSSAFSAVVAGRTAIQWASKNRQARRNARNFQLLRRELQHTLIPARRRRWLELAVGSILHAFVASENTNEFLSFVVIRCQIFVADRPIESFAVPAVRLEV